MTRSVKLFGWLRSVMAEPILLQVLSNRGLSPRVPAKAPWNQHCVRREVAPETSFGCICLSLMRWRRSSKQNTAAATVKGPGQDGWRRVPAE